MEVIELARAGLQSFLWNSKGMPWEQVGEPLCTSSINVFWQIVLKPSLVRSFF